MKHALVLFSSPHKDGHTKKLLEAFLDGLKGKDWKVKSLDICKVNIHPCIACGYCQKADGCAFRDLDEFDRDLRACDLLLIATPVYNLSFPAQFKAVIDRGSELKRDADDVIYDKKTHKLTELGQLAEDAWHAAYAADSQEFSALQDAYGYQEYYLPVERIVRKYGLDLSGRADCLKGLCWGMNNLFGSGGCQKFFKMANLSNDMSDEQAVTAICDALIDYMTNTSTNQYAASYANRYTREKKTCLTYLAQHKTENDANKDTSGSGSDTGSDAGAGSGSGAGSDSNNGSGSDSGTGSGSGSTDQPSQGTGGGSSAAGGTVTTPAGGGTTGSPNAASTDAGAGSTSSPDAGSSADSGNGSASSGDSSSNAPSGAPSDSVAGSNGSADAGGDSGDDAGDANGGATNGDTSDNGASSGADTQGSGSTSLPGTDGKPDDGKDGADSKDDGGKGQGDKGISGQGKAMAKAGADKADTKSGEVEKLPATADASTIGLVVSAALSLSGVGAVVVGKRRSALLFFNAVCRFFSTRLK